MSALGVRGDLVSVFDRVALPPPLAVRTDLAVTVPGLGMNEPGTSLGYNPKRGFVEIPVYLSFELQTDGTAGNRNIRISITDQDGKEVFSVSGPRGYTAAAFFEFFVDIHGTTSYSDGTVNTQLYMAPTPMLGNSGLGVFLSNAVGPTDILRNGRITVVRAPIGTFDVPGVPASLDVLSAVGDLGA